MLFRSVLVAVLVAVLVVGERSCVGIASQSFLSIVFEQRVDHFVELPLQDLVELVEGQSDAVVGESVLREVVCPDALATVTGADQPASRLGP